VRVHELLRYLFLSVAFFLFCVFLTGCMIVRAPSPEELRALDHPPPGVLSKVDRLFPLAIEWYGNVERQQLPRGRPLSQAEEVVARKLGVHHPQRVRVITLEKFPMPANNELLAAAQRYGMGSEYEGARTFGYAIMVKPRFADDSTVITHELVHVGQHDRMGRAAFVRRYLVEMEMMGYARAPLELDAYRKQDTSR
jgi:hypothetical protein